MQRQQPLACDDEHRGQSLGQLLPAAPDEQIRFGLRVVELAFQEKGRTLEQARRLASCSPLTLHTSG